jgi:hypothetical protein
VGTHWIFCVYLSFLSFFHIMEFFMTGFYHPETLTVNCKHWYSILF